MTVDRGVLEMGKPEGLLFDVHAVPNELCLASCHGMTVDNEWMSLVPEMSSFLMLFVWQENG